MKKSIEQKIAKLILGLQVRDEETLLSNMVVIEHRVHKMPALLEWMEPRLTLDDSFQPTGYCNLYSTTVDSLVKLWIFVLQARYGNLAFRYVPALDLASWGMPSFPENLSELSALKWIRCDAMPLGSIPQNLVLWVSATVYATIPHDVRQQFRWVIQLDDTICVEMDNVIGLDAYDATVEVWDAWCNNLDWTKIEVCRVPSFVQEFSFLNQTPLLKVLDCSDLQESEQLLRSNFSLPELKVLRLLNSNLKELPAWVQQSQNLTDLEIGWNPIQDLPTWITCFNQLKFFNCAYTEFQNFPVSIFQNLDLLQLVVRSVGSKITKAWLTEVHELNTKCTVIRQRNHHPQHLWSTSLRILG